MSICERELALPSRFSRVMLHWGSKVADWQRDHLVSLISLLAISLLGFYMGSFGIMLGPPSAKAWAPASFFVVGALNPALMLSSLKGRFIADDGEHREDMSPEVAFDNAVHRIRESIYSLPKRGPSGRYKVIGWGELMRSLFDEDEDWVSELLEIASLGRSSSSFSPLSEYRAQLVGAGKSESDAIIKAMEEDYRKGAEELEDLLTLWQGYPGSSLLCLAMEDWSADDAKHVAEMLGVDYMIDAYYSGVPVEDIVA